MGGAHMISEVHSVGAQPDRRKRAGSVAGAVLACLLAGVVSAPAQEACAPLPEASGKHRSVESYTSTLELCERSGVRRVAIRTMRIDGAAALLLVNPDRLSTTLDPAACWTCAPATDADIAETRFETAVRGARERQGKTIGE